MNKESKKPFEHFVKLYNEINLDKYKSNSYKKLFELTSVQNMHDADLAYHHIYLKCAENANSRQSLLSCLEYEQKFLFNNSAAFNPAVYKKMWLML